MPARPRRTAVTAVAGGALLLLLPGCGVLPPGGEIVSKTREIDDAVGVRLDATGTVTLTQGEEASLEVTAAESVIDRVTTEVIDGILVIDIDRSWFRRNGAVTYDLVLPSVEHVELDGSGLVVVSDVGTPDLEVRIDGSGTVDLDGLDTAELDVRIDGSGTVRADGSTARLDVGIDGSGDYVGTDLRSQDATADLGGSGRIALHAARTLDARIGGSGEIRYTGDPSLSSHVSGSGTILPE